MLWPLDPDKEEDEEDACPHENQKAQHDDYVQLLSFQIHSSKRRLLTQTTQSLSTLPI